MRWQKEGCKMNYNEKQDMIEIVHANEHNLKNISLAISKKKITIVTGVSGSGKSSLIFDTIAAESQRMLNDTYSSYIQQMIPHYGRPLVEKIKNLPVSIVIDQKKWKKYTINGWNDNRYLCVA